MKTLICPSCGMKLYPIEYGYKLPLGVLDYMCRNRGCDIVSISITRQQKVK